MKARKTRINPKVEMSPEAVDRRLRTLGQLYRLAKSLKTSRRLGKVKDIRAQEAKESADT